jgi:hypothetical protein
MSRVTAALEIRRIVFAVLLAGLLAALLGAARAASSPTRSGVPIVVVVRHGGLCVTGRECRSELRIDDATVSGDGYRPRPLAPGDRVALLRAIGKLDLRSIRAHPFTGTCPTAYDGSESIYRFRRFPRALPSCTYDLRRVEAVRLVEKLLASLRPAPR